MSPDQYPAQEPFTAIGAKYHDEVLRRGRDVQAVEIAYGADRYQAIAVVPSEKPNGDVFIALHGGGWTNGYKEWMLFMAPALTAQGVTFVSAGYRLAPRHVFPEGYRGRAGRGRRNLQGSARNLAASRIAFSSAGIRRAVISRRWRLCATTGLQGATSPRMSSAAPCRSRAPTISAKAPAFRCGRDFSAHPAARRTRPPPPFNIYGPTRRLSSSPGARTTFRILRKQAEAFAAALRAAGVDVETLVLPGCDHLGASYESAEPHGRWVSAASRWMREH